MITKKIIKEQKFRIFNIFLFFDENEAVIS